MSESVIDKPEVESFIADYFKDTGINITKIDVSFNGMIHDRILIVFASFEKSAEYSELELLHRKSFDNELVKSINFSRAKDIAFIELYDNPIWYKVFHQMFESIYGSKS